MRHEPGELYVKTEAEGTWGKKKVYEPPKLIGYGNVRSFTLAANSGSAEGSMGMPNMATSERRFKDNIVKIGMHPVGIGLYLFDYRPEYRDACGHGRQFGVMADEVEQVMPEAVSVHPDGYKVVDYTMLGISRDLH